MVTASIIVLLVGIGLLLVEGLFFENFRLQLVGWIIIIVTGLIIIFRVSFLRNIVLTLLKTPYYIIKGIQKAGTKADRRRKDKKIESSRSGMKAIYESFEVIEEKQGSYKKWEKNLMQADSEIGIILGARGSGKSAFGLKLLENVYAKTERKCYAMGFKREEMPFWISVVDSVSDLKNDSVVLIDESGVLFSSRRSMTSANKLLGDLILIARHKNLTILFISQNSSNLDINIIRQADFLALKSTSLLQKDFERKKIKDIYKEVEKDFKKYEDDKGITYVYGGKFRGFVSNPLPSFWSVRISKSFR